MAAIRSYVSGALGKLDKLDPTGAASADMRVLSCTPEYVKGVVAAGWAVFWWLPVQPDRVPVESYALVASPLPDVLGCHEALWAR